MNSSAQLAKQQIGRGIACKTEVNKETILEGISFNIHLLVTEPGAGADVVLPANHVKRIGNRKNVGAALEGSETPVTQSPIVVHQGGSQAAAYAVFCRLRNHTSRSIRAFAIQIRAEDADVGGFARAVSER